MNGVRTSILLRQTIGSLPLEGREKGVTQKKGTARIQRVLDRSGLDGLRSEKTTITVGGGKLGGSSADLSKVRK